MRWDGTRWQQESTLLAFDLARAVCRDAAERCGNESTRGRICSAPTVAAVPTLARVDRRLAATVDQWDADPWLLNTPGGVVDLRTGETRPCRPDDYMTKITAVAPGESPCPLWLKFLDRVTGDDRSCRPTCSASPATPDRHHARARAVLRLRHRRQRQGRVRQHALRHHGRLCRERRRSRPSPSIAHGDRHPTDLADAPRRAAGDGARRPRKAGAGPRRRSRR